MSARLTGLTLPQVLDDGRRRPSERDARQGTMECLGSSRERGDQELRRSEALRHHTHEEQTRQAVWSLEEDIPQGLSGGRAVWQRTGL